MTKPTRIALVGSGVVVLLGTCAGLLAYLSDARRPPVAQHRPEVNYLPPGAVAVGYVDVRTFKNSEFGRRLRAIVPDGDGRREVLRETGIDLERDVDAVTWAWDPGEESNSSGQYILVLRGRFETRVPPGTKTEHYREHLVRVRDGGAAGAGLDVAVVSDDLALLGRRTAVRAAIDAAVDRHGLSSKSEWLERMARAGQANASWAIASADVLRGLNAPVVNLTENVGRFSWVDLTLSFQGDATGVVRVEANDDASADGIRRLVTAAVGAAALLDERRYSVRVSTNNRMTEVAFRVSPDLMTELVAVTGATSGRTR